MLTKFQASKIGQVRTMKKVLSLLSIFLLVSASMGQTIVRVAGGTSPFQVAYTTTAQATANVSTAQNLVAFALPAGKQSKANKTFRIKGSGTYSLGASSTVAFGVKVCTISGCGSGTVVTPCLFTTGSNTNTAVTSTFNFECTVGTVTAGASGTLLGKGTAAIEVGAANTAAATVFGDVTTAVTAAIDLTAADFIQTQVTFGSANASNTATLMIQSIEFLN